MKSILPTNIKKIALFFERLPGIGEKTANRLAFYLLRLPELELKEFGESIITLKSKTKLCKSCLNLTEEDLCIICQDNNRDQSIVTIVEETIDLIAFETGNNYQGYYHILHGRIDPLNRVRPEDIYIDQLIKRVKDHEEIKEIILATNPDMEGEATAMFIRDRLKELKETTGKQLKITRLAYGLPIGASLEYADYMTLRKSLEGRRDFT